MPSRGHAQARAPRASAGRGEERRRGREDGREQLAVAAEGRELDLGLLEAVDAVEDLPQRRRGRWRGRTRRPSAPRCSSAGPRRSGPPPCTVCVTISPGEGVLRPAPASAPRRRAPRGPCRPAPPWPGPGRWRWRGRSRRRCWRRRSRARPPCSSACERRRRVSEVARPEPMAVPSGSMSSRTSSSCRSSTAVSVVGGALVRLWPAKTTRPMRSRRRRSTKSATTSLATASRFRGWKSSAAMEPETSRATTMSTPWVVTSSRSVPAAGGPGPRRRRRGQSAASTSGRWRSRDAPARAAPRSARRRPGTTTARAAVPLAQPAPPASTSGPASAAQSQSGSWKRKPAQSIRPPSLPVGAGAPAAAAPRARPRAPRTAARCRSASCAGPRPART